MNKIFLNICCVVLIAMLFVSIHLDVKRKKEYQELKDEILSRKIECEAILEERLEEET
jgi:hypothetical protein